MEKETMGTVISVTKQWWLKVNRKPARVHAMDGAAFPHTIKVKYTIDGKDYMGSPRQCCLMIDQPIRRGSPSFQKRSTLWEMRLE